jgi:bifunctional non-homologous end joining protein LigD
VKPEVVARVKYRELTSEGRLRQPVFLGFRDDAVPRECTVAGEIPGRKPKLVRSASSAPVLREPEEIERELNRGKREEAILEIEGRPVRVRNLNKVYFPEAGHTKRDLLAWYYHVAPMLLPFLESRPLVLHRYPNGIAGSPFYQKDAGLERPEWIETVRIASEGRTKEIEYYLANDVAALLFLANLGCIEQNPWSSRVPDSGKPDYLFFDLDPVEGAPFATAVTVARGIAKLLKEIGCTAFFKTSGATGMHIYLPLEPVYSYEQGRSFVEIVARVAAAHMPGLTTLERSVARRPEGTIYLDYSQNGYGRPLASVYSVRPVAQAAISAPVTASELRKTLVPGRFTLRTMRTRLSRKGDLWGSFWGKRQRIEEPLARLVEIAGEGRGKNQATI